MVSDTLWHPSATIASLKQRAQCIAAIRQFFTTRGYLEVETPIMARYGVTDVYLSNIPAQFRGHTYYLQTSPEYAMKRLLAAGSGNIFQLARVFRDDELGRWHNPEFTLLEWYCLGIDHHVLMAECDALLQQAFACQPLVKKTYRQAFLDSCGLDPLHASLNELKQVVRKFALHNVLEDDEEDRDQYLFLLMSHVVEASLAAITSPVAIYDYPPSQAALAKINGGVAERFEIYFQGVELANGFHELTEVDLQRQRFADDLQLRKAKGLPAVEVDFRLLNALAEGLPSCSGVALGVDRLVALALGKKELSSVLGFDFSRA